MAECSKCSEEKTFKRDGCNTPGVIEINNPAETVMFYRVDVPASEGDDETIPPVNGKYKNVLLVYEANNHAYLYNSVGIPTRLYGSTNFDELDYRPKYAGNEMTSQTDIPDVEATVEAEVNARKAADELLQTTINNEVSERQENVSELSNRIDAEEDARTQADTAISADLEQEIADRTAGDTAINTAINKTVVTDFSVNDTPSTTSIVLDGAKENILTGATSTRSITLPVASGSQAGVINTSTYNAIQENSQNIDAILGGAVAISNLPAEPTQAELTTAWQTATGLTTLINGARIFDNTNEKNWTYYTNTTTWYATDASGSTTVSTATNTSLGIVKGDATTDGKAFVEADGSLSINGWDQITNNVADALSDIASLQTQKVDKIADKGLSTNDYTTAEKNKLSSIEAGAEVNAPNTVIDASYVHTDNNYTTTEKDKLAGLSNANNATITITQGGTTKGSFTTNQSNNATIALDAGGSTTVSIATNSTPGIVQGDATTDGKVFVESNGTMSLNGWDDLSVNVSNNIANIASLQSDKVDKVTGKGLSTEDYTTADKNKLANLNHETWTFTLSDNTTVTKEVVIWGV